MVSVCTLSQSWACFSLSSGPPYFGGGATKEKTLSATPYRPALNSFAWSDFFQYFSLTVHVALAYNACLPVQAYGGTERVIWWLHKGLAELGCQVTLVGRPGSHSPFAHTVAYDFSGPWERLVPQADIYHHFVTPPYAPQKPYVVTIGGNGKLGERFLENTIFISKNHAKRHGADCFVYHGLDPSEYVFQPKKDKNLVFLAKASWSVKNVKGAIRLAKKTQHPLRIIGGKGAPWKRWWDQYSDIHWEGMLGGQKKAEILSTSRALLFPILWNEPFGLALIEALVSGTPVIGRPLGSLPELIPAQTGFLGDSEETLEEAIFQVSKIDPEACHQWVLSRFHYIRMAKNYLRLYEQVLDGIALNSQIPQASEPPQRFYPLPRHTH